MNTATRDVRVTQPFFADHTLSRQSTDPPAALESAHRRVPAPIERCIAWLPGTQLVGAEGLEFLLEFARDVRSPLRAVQLLADQMLRGLSGPLSPLQAHQLGIIAGAAYTVNAVTTNALQMTREWNPLPEPVARRFSVTRLLSEVRDEVRTVAAQPGLDIMFIRPSVDGRSGHPSELRQILVNLVINAIDVTRVGRITVRATDQEHDRVEFAVQDSGPGIPASAQATLFNAFRRSEDDGHAIFSAGGLRLAMTNRLVRALGGQLAYETVPGQGTRFSFVLDLPAA